MAIGKGLLLAGVGLGGLALLASAKRGVPTGPRGRIIGKSGTEYYEKATTISGAPAMLVYAPGKQFGSTQDMYLITYVWKAGKRTLKAWNTGAPAQMVSNAMLDLAVVQPKAKAKAAA